MPYSSPGMFQDQMYFPKYEYSLGSVLFEYLWTCFQITPYKAPAAHHNAID